MSKKKSKRKRRKKDKVSTKGPKGYDFGSPERSLVVASFDFIELLSKADIFACAYGETISDELGRELPIVSLVGKGANDLKKTFDEFHRWGAGKDGDAVALTFIFLKDGGYLLGVSPDPELLSQRLNGYDRVFVPLQYGGSWVKKFDTRNEMLEWLEEYKNNLVSPFLFSAAAYPSVNNFSVPNPDLVRPIEDLKPILKFKASFTREEDVKKYSQEWGILQVHQLKESETVKRENHNDILKKLEKEHRDNPESFIKRRQEILSRHFPVTLARVQRSEKHTDCLEQLLEHGVRPWQVEQAVCNIVLSKTICGEYHYTSIEKKEFQNKILYTIQERFEQADNKHYVDSLSLDAIRCQVELDSISLLAHFKIKPKARSLQSILERLKEEGLLGD